ncbi:MAG: FISUMP domain-containing protein [Patescibacteria group bacterium]|nr:FISUMP domain-containing protein [Patescibacteria group bacterium]
MGNFFNMCYNFNKQSESSVAKARMSELKQSNSPLAGKIGQEYNFSRPLKGAAKNLAAIKAAALLAGNRNNNGNFNNHGSNANFWSSSVSEGNAWRRNLNSGNSTVNRNTNNQANGFSVRCLKDCLIIKAAFCSAVFIYG